MQKATPLILVLILATAAAFFSLRSKDGDTVTKPPVAEAPAKPQTPASDKAENPEKPADPPPVAKVAPRPWPQEGSDIAADPNAVFGALDNGLRYIIYPNGDPKQRVSLRLHISAGSLMEAEDQRGLAHFLEHMVFNGTKNNTSAELVPRMQRLGIGFGAHVNAYTSFDETVYMLDLPDLSEETMNICFTVMRDFGDGALLDPAEIDKERGVILAEKISRDSVAYRLMQKQFQSLLPDSLLTNRFPIGTEEVIKSAARDRFADLYTRFYTPGRMTFVVVGDVNPDDIRKRIEAGFSSMVNPENAGPDPDMGAIRQPEGLEPVVFADKEVTSTEVSLTLVRPHVVKPDTSATRAEKMPLDIANSILSRRFERISKEKDSPVAQGSASKDNLFNHVDLGTVTVTASNDRWQDVVPVLEREFRRAMEHGFTEVELAEAKSNLINAYEQEVKQKATRKSDGLATVIARGINSNDVISTPETDLEIAEKCLEAIDTAACHKAFRTFWECSGYHLILTTKTEPENAVKELAALFEESRGTPVEAPALRAIQVFEYTTFGKTGTIATRKEIDDMGITQLVLSNKVRINLKRTDFEQGKIRLSARIGSGQLTQPKNSPMLSDFAQAVFEGGGLGKHSNEDLQQILAGKNVGSSLLIAEDHFRIVGSTTPADFTTQCQLMCASITDPGYREEALWQFQKAIPMIEQQLKHTPAGPQMEMKGWLHGGDARYSPATMNKLKSYTISDAKKWLGPELTKGALELSVIGDFEMDKILPELLATFGSLPTRATAHPALPEARKVKFPNAPAAKEFTYESQVKQAVAIAIWKTAGIRDNQKELRRLNILADILADRLRIEVRENLGASYSPDAGATGSEALDGIGYLVGQSVGKPGDLEKLIETMRDEAAKLARDGATKDELERALNPILSNLEKSLRDNNYWIGTVMDQCQQDSKRIELARTRDADYASITVEEINQLAKKYLGAERAIFVSIKPAAEK
jgi:zinc protease